MKKNVKNGERLFNLAAAVVLLRKGMKRKGLGGLVNLAAGGALGLRAMTGYCSLYNALGISTVPRQKPQHFNLSTNLPIMVQKTLLIRAPQKKVFEQLTNFETLKPVLEKLERLHPKGNDNSSWSIDLPLGKKLSWDVELSEKKSPNTIEFRSKDDSGKGLQFEGKLDCQAKSKGRRTLVTVSLAMQAPGGVLGNAIASSLTTFVEATLKFGLRQFKETLETGEVSTTSKQPQGPSISQKAQELKESVKTQPTTENKERKLQTSKKTKKDEGKQSGRAS